MVLILKMILKQLKDTYYFDENGYMVTGWKKINNKDYFFNDSGFMVKDTWQGAYYLGSDGVMLINAFTKDGYYVGLWCLLYKSLG